MAGELRLYDGEVEVAFDHATGGVTRLRDGTGPPIVDGPPSLFVVEIPRAGDRTVTITTADQTLTHAEHDGDETLALIWDGLLTSAGERLDGRISVSAALSGGVLQLSLKIEIPEAGAEAVRFPALRGIDPRDGGSLTYRGVDYTQGTSVRLLPVFDSNSPYWGTMFPDHASQNLRPEVVGSPTSPFVILAGERGGVTVMPARQTLDFVGWRTSLEPGYSDSVLRTAGRPGGETAATVTFEAIHFTPADAATVVLTPMCLAPYRGAWLKGLDPYRSIQGPTRVSGAPWLREPGSWLQIQLMSTEGEPRYTFDQLVDVIEECAERGICAIQIVGWNEGGQDGHVPEHRPAEKLGGEAGLRRALDRARQLDVRPILYVKYQWVEKPGPAWERLEQWVCRDENGQPYAQPGPVYHTARKRYGVNTPWYVPLCFAVPDLRSSFAAEVARMAEWGAAGVLADESLYHGRALLCFAHNHGHEPGASAFGWDGDFVEDVRAAIPNGADEFVIAGEGAYDAQLQHYDVSYFRSASASHVPVGRHLRPGARIVTALTGFDDRNMANQCLLYGYAASFEPFNFKGRPRDMPRTIAYMTAVDGIRRRFTDWLWDGELIADHNVTAGADSGPDPHLAVWRNAGNSHPDTADVVVVANTEDEARDIEVEGIEAAAVTIHVDGGEETFTGHLRLDPRSAAAIVPANVAATSRSRTR